MSTASWLLLSWLGVVDAPVPLSGLQSPGTPRLECVLPDDADARVYRLIDRGETSSPRWWLTLRAPSLGSREIELPLANARVERSPEGTLSVASRSLNGGLAVEIRPDASAFRFDVFVNFELEVNVWRDLSPDIEHMNTGGARNDARCRSLSSPDGLP